jgi:hypothetical protein
MSKTVEIKKLFSKHSNVNFFQDYTLQDLEDAKKRLYFKMMQEGHKGEEVYLQKKIDGMAQELIQEKFNPTTPSTTVGAIVKNTVRDNLNPNYKNTIRRLINLDSQYRPNLYPYANTTTDDKRNPNTIETNYIAHLSEKLDNVVSIQIENIQIPYTMYNVEAAQGNNYFVVGTQKYVVPDGFYTLATLKDAMNTLMVSTDLVISIPDITKKTVITNSGSAKTIVFYSSENDTEYTKYNNNLGWILGFRDIKAYVNNTVNIINMEYIVPASRSITAEAVGALYVTKYIIIAVDEFNKNVTNGTIIQTKLETATIKPTTYWNYQDKTQCLSNLTCDNMDDYVNPTTTQGASREQSCGVNDIAIAGRTLTRAQLFSQAQINNNRNKINQQDLRLECDTPSNVLGLIPFEPKIEWGAHYFNDKIDYKREYHGPIDIEKLEVKIFNDKGFPIHFNGGDWNITISTEHLYKY